MHLARSESPFAVVLEIPSGRFLVVSGLTDWGAMVELDGTRLWSRAVIISRSVSQTLAPGRGQNEVRTFFQTTTDEIDIPVYDFPTQSNPHRP